ncbi:amidohydrolase [Parasphingopyxis algicola]|uniref:amidohydrolase n=1 Tax=Parasphingopyxis algicola TaxID=2026624 RepID=UPI0015A0E674|nr:amidohydrolase [Parasphingopyxis algicola]QLC23597.1 amidohydrolase [Parasphingopyxis algicola]
MKKPAFLIAATLALFGCATTGSDSTSSAGAAQDRESATAFDPDPFPSTYRPYPGRPTVIRGATIYDGEGGQIDNGMVYFADGHVQAIGQTLDVPEGATEIDGTGLWVTPGIIDIHSHLGNYPSPSVAAHQDGNEITGNNTANVWTEHSVWPQDPGFSRALANGGVTTLNILPGSANLFGGRSVTLRNVPSRTMQGMKFPGAPYGLKMACGENPKRVYGSRNQTPGSRMANVAVARQAWIDAQRYQYQWENYRENGGTRPARNLRHETLAGVMNGDILVHNHCYRADEMAIMIDMAEEFGYSIASFQHAVEAYKIPDLLREHGICAAMWADWWGFKMEAYDTVFENVPMVHNGGACAIVHSDDENQIQRLNQEAAKALADGRRAGIQISDAEAWQWLTINPARALGIADETGSLVAGKRADLVLWNGDPFSVYSRPQMVWIDGALLYDMNDPQLRPIADFELGQPSEGSVR